MNMASFRPVGSVSFVALLSWEQNVKTLFNKCSNHFSIKSINLAARPSLATLVEGSQNGMCAKILQRQRILSAWTPGLLTLKIQGSVPP